jgi:hypothetical protein
MRKLLLGLLLTGNAFGATIKIEATTKDAFGAWFMPTRIDSTSTITLGQGYSCTNMVRGDKFQLLCRHNNRNVLIYTDSTPQKDAIIATPDMVVKITTMEEKNDK